MKRSLPWILGVVMVLLAVYWVAGNTEWVEVPVPMPPSGEAVRDPYYAAVRLVEALGAQGSSGATFVVPPAGSVLVISALHWTVSDDRRSAIERWVESGGRLVVAGALTGGDSEFGRWSGITRTPRKRESGDTAWSPCRSFQDEAAAGASGDARRGRHLICSLDVDTFLETRTAPVWVLRDRSGIQAARVNVQRGSVTVINAEPFTRRRILEADHGWLLATATDLRRGDVVHFLSESDVPSLLALVWRHGGPVVVLTLVFVGAWVWRDSPRFGPMIAAPLTARRSLLEQIRGTGRFALRHAGGEAIHDACVRALHAVARRRIPGYDSMSPRDRADSLASLSGYNREALAAALHHPSLRRPQELLGTVALLESARRRLLLRRTR